MGIVTKVDWKNRRTWTVNFEWIYLFFVSFPPCLPATLVCSDKEHENGIVARIALDEATRKNSRTKLSSSFYFTSRGRKGWTKKSPKKNSSLTDWINWIV